MTSSLFGNVSSINILKYKIPCDWCIPSSPGSSRYLSSQIKDNKDKKKYLKVVAKPFSLEDGQLMMEKCLNQVQDKGRLWARRYSYGRQQNSIKGTGSILGKYEKWIGLTDVNQLQEDVMQCESMLLESMQERGEVTAQITDNQRRMKEIHNNLEKTVRGENKYLLLAMQEHHAIKEEQSLLSNLRLAENRERQSMTDLSINVRKSQEKERALAERTKYWTLISLMVGLVSGILGSAVCRA